MPGQTTDTLKALAKLKEEIPDCWEDGCMFQHPCDRCNRQREAIDSAISLTLKAAKEAVEGAMDHASKEANDEHVENCIGCEHASAYLGRKESLTALDSLSQQLSWKG